MSKQVYKYKLPPGPGEFTVLLPVGAEILTAKVQPICSPVLWALVDVTAPSEERKFTLEFTGLPVGFDEGRYIATYELYGLMYHLFEVLDER